MSDLFPCSSCARHVRANETRCPFCGSAPAETPASRPEPKGRLARAAVFAGAGALSAAISCQTPEPAQPNYQTPPPQQVADAAPPTMVSPPPPHDFADPPPDDPQDPPPPPDAAPVATADAGPTPDAAEPVIHKHHMPKPYGAPPARRRVV